MDASEYAAPAAEESRGPSVRRTGTYHVDRYRSHRRRRLQDLHTAMLPPDDDGQQGGRWHDRGGTGRDGEVGFRVASHFANAGPAGDGRGPAGGRELAVSQTDASRRSATHLGDGRRAAGGVQR